MSAQHKPEVPAHHAAAADAPPPVTIESPAPDVVSGATPADPAPDIAALLQKVEAEAAELRDAWLRSRAEIDNVRKQGIADVARAHKYGIERFAGEQLGCAQCGSLPWRGARGNGAGQDQRAQEARHRRRGAN